jgi:hypothetical protein
VNISNNKTVKTQGGPQKDLKSWNDSVGSQKYFDINVDKREKRLQANKTKTHESVSKLVQNKFNSMQVKQS